LGITFLLIGLTFALPMRLVPVESSAAVSNFLSPEVANVYACVAWAGWAHFIYAFKGQSGALARVRDQFKHGRLIAYAGCVMLIILALTGVRWLSGVAAFGAVVWVYFIDHFIKAERSFEGKTGPSSLIVRWLSSYQLILTFGWLSVVLMNAGGINSHRWLLWAISLALGVGVLVFGGWQRLAKGDVRGPLLSLFFVAESLVWGTFSQYGGPSFLFGVYVFHIAAGSYAHYLGSYFYAMSRSQGKDRWLTPVAILFTNGLIIGIGFLVANFHDASWLDPILGIQWFTLWVAVHLVASDVFPYFKSLRLR